MLEMLETLRLQHDKLEQQIMKSRDQLLMTKGGIQIIERLLAQEAEEADLPTVELAGKNSKPVKAKEK